MVIVLKLLYFSMLNESVHICRMCRILSIEFKSIIFIHHENFNVYAQPLVTLSCNECNESIHTIMSILS